MLSDVNIIRWGKTAFTELSDVNIIRCRKTDIIEFCLMLISSHVEKQTTLNFVWGSYHIIQKNSYHWILSDANIIGCRKTASIEFYLMLTSSDAEKQWSLSDVRIMCQKTGVIKFCLMIWWYKHPRKFSGSCFSASDDINIRGNSMIAVFMYLMILTSDRIPW